MTTFYYVLPGVGIFGGVKKGFQCVEFLSTLGLEARVATPGGASAEWFEHGALTVPRERLPELASSEDVLLFSLPQDAEFIETIPVSRRIVHMQGANTARDIALMRKYPQFDFISHGHHMSARLCEQGIVAPYVPNSISAVFSEGVEDFVEGTIAVMPRKGTDILDWVRENLTHTVRWKYIDGQTETGVAESLQEADVFLAISPHEAFGLPVLEAMAARCCVVGFTGDGGYEFMHHGTSAHVVANDDAQGLLDALRVCLDDDSYRDRLRNGGARTAAFYTPDRERNCLRAALEWIGCL